MANLRARRRSTSAVLSAIALCLAATVVAAGGSAQAATTSASTSAAKPTPKIDIPNVDHAHGDVTGTDCVSNSWCLLVDAAGAARTYSHGQWSAPSQVDPDGLAAVSCVSTAFCVAAATGDNRAERYNGRSWHRDTIAGVTYVKGLSCVSGSFCMAAGYYADGPQTAYGVVSEWNGKAWSKVTRLGDGPLSAVSCVSRTFCAAVADDGALSANVAAIFNGKKWSTKTFQYEFGGVSCASTHYCAATTSHIDSEGDGTNEGVLTWNGTTWANHKNFGEGVAGPIACASASFCIAGQASGANVLRFNGTKWLYDTVEGDSDNVGAAAVSCPSVSACLFLDSLGDGYWWDGSRWSVPDFAADVIAVNCTTASDCIGVGSDFSTSTYDGTSFTPGAAARRNRSLTGASCASPTFCIGLDKDYGVTYRFDGTSWTPQDTGSLNPLDEVSCASSTLCVATGTNGNGHEAASVYNGTTWSPAHSLGRITQPGAVGCGPDGCLVTGYDDAGEVLWAQYTGSDATWSTPAVLAGIPTPGVLWCGSANHCMLMSDANADENGTASVATSFDGTGWSAPTRIAAFNAPTSISCTHTGFCLAVGWTGIAAYRNGRWGATGFAGPEGTAPGAVSCMAGPSCLLAGDGPLVSLDGGTWSIHGRVDADGGLARVSCARPTKCVALGTGEASAYNGTAWSASRLIDPGAGYMPALSCAPSGFCAAGGESDDGGEVLTDTGSTWSDPQIIFGGRVDALACPSATFCLAVGETYSGAPRWSRYDGSSWTADKPIPHLSGAQPTAVSCPSTTHCTVTTFGSSAVTYSSGNWSARASLHVLLTYDASCPTPKFCAVGAVKFGGSTDQIVRHTASGWQKPTSLKPGDGVVAVSCPTATMCVGASYQHWLYRYNGSTWTASAAPTGGWPAADLDCPSTKFCVLAEG